MKIELDIRKIVKEKQEVDLPFYYGFFSKSQLDDKWYLQRLGYVDGFFNHKLICLALPKIDKEGKYSFSELEITIEENKERSLDLIESIFYSISNFKNYSSTDFKSQYVIINKVQYDNLLNQLLELEIPELLKVDFKEDDIYYE